MRIGGQDTVPVGAAGGVSIGIVGPLSCRRGDGSVGQAIDLGDLRLLKDGEFVDGLSAEGIGDGAAAVGIVVGDFGEIDAAGELGGETAAGGIIGPGGVAIAVFIDDAGEG